MTFFYYFAYGSNLLKSRIRIQNKGAEYVGNGRLEGFKLHFVSYSQRWKGALATILEEEGAEVIGCVWKIPMDFSVELDKQEYSYHRLSVPIHCFEDGQAIECRTYQFDDLAAPETRPSPHYKTVIYAGAVEHDLPHDYLERLFAIEDNGFRGRVEVDLEVIRHLNLSSREEENKG